MPQPRQKRTPGGWERSAGRKQDRGCLTKPQRANGSESGKRGPKHSRREEAAYATMWDANGSHCQPRVSLLSCNSAGSRNARDKGA